MMPSGEQTALFLRLVTVLIPMGMYFLLLGLLNSHQHPQLLSGRRDFTLLLTVTETVRPDTQWSVDVTVN